VKVQAHHPIKILVTPELVQRTKQMRQRYKAFGELVLAEFDSSISMYRVVDEAEMRRILATKRITGGNYSVKPEREVGASWGHDISAILNFGQSNTDRLKGRLFILKIEAIGKTFLHLDPREGVKEDPWSSDLAAPVRLDFDADRANPGLGASIEDVSLDDVDDIYEVMGRHGPWRKEPDGSGGFKWARDEDKAKQMKRVTVKQVAQELSGDPSKRLDAAVKALYRTRIPMSKLLPLDEAVVLLSSTSPHPSTPASELQPSAVAQHQEKIPQTFEARALDINARLRARAEAAASQLVMPAPLYDDTFWSGLALLDADAEVPIAGGRILGSGDRNHSVVVLIPVPEAYTTGFPDPEVHNHGHKPHVTLCFVTSEEMSAGQLSTVLGTVRRVCHRFPPFRLRLDVNAGLRDFGDGKEGEKALWVPVLCEPRGEIERLHRGLKIALEAEGISLQAHSDFIPHVTWTYVSNWIPEAERAQIDSVAGDRFAQGRGLDGEFGDGFDA
jgi:2'-5' RNA ligase